VDVDLLLDRVLGALPVLGPWYRTTEGRKKVRYGLVSVVAVPVGEVGLLFFNLIGLTAGWAAVCGNSVGAIPSYLLNRYWVWGKNDRNKFFAEIMPFWAITVIGIAFSLYVGHEGGAFARRHDIGGATRLAILLVANLGGFAVLWVVKFVLFNRLLFVVRRPGEESVEAVASGEDVPH
jgi:putative flippase GtrA